MLIQASLTRNRVEQKTVENIIRRLKTLYLNENQASKLKTYNIRTT